MQHAWFKSVINTDSLKTESIIHPFEGGIIAFGQREETAFFCPEYLDSVWVIYAGTLMKRESSWSRKYLPFLLRLLLCYCVAQKQVRHNSSQCQYMDWCLGLLVTQWCDLLFTWGKLCCVFLTNLFVRAPWQPPLHGPPASLWAGDCSAAWRSWETACQDSVRDLCLFLCCLPDMACWVRPGWEWWWWLPIDE